MIYSDIWYTSPGIWYKLGYISKEFYINKIDITVQMYYISLVYYISLGYNFKLNWYFYEQQCIDKSIRATQLK